MFLLTLRRIFVPNGRQTPFGAQQVVFQPQDQILPVTRRYVPVVLLLPLCLLNGSGERLQLLTHPLHLLSKLFYVFTDFLDVRLVLFRFAGE